MSEEPFVRTEQVGNALIVSPASRFVASAEANLVDELDRLKQQVEAADVQNIVVDLGGITYFGSALLEWMVGLWKQAREKGGQLAACNPSPMGREVLAVARFDRLWGIFNSRDEALEWLAAGKR